VFFSQAGRQDPLLTSAQLEATSARQESLVVGIERACTLIVEREFRLLLRQLTERRGVCGLIAGTE